MRTYNLKSVLLAVTATLILIACDNDDDFSTDIAVEAPLVYSFERNNATTVSFSGQSTRISMGDELLDALKDPSLNASDLTNIYSHQSGDNNFTDAALNASDKNLRSKTAASSDFFSSNSTASQAVKNTFDSYLEEQANTVFPAWNNTAAAGTPGQLQEAGGGSIRYVNGDGLELNQAFNKGLIGALMVDQMLNNYLSPAVLDEASNRADNDNSVLASGKNYTTMEHKWDEAFGYLYGAEADITNPELNIDDFLNKYLSRVENDADFTGIAAQIYDAFKLGRAAIVAQDYEFRDRQADIIKEKVSEIIGIRAVYYLQQGIATRAAGDTAGAFHDLSEGYGFIYSLQFTRRPGTDEPYLSAAQVQDYINLLEAGNGFWDVTDATLNQLSDEIASQFNFTVAQAGS